MRLERSWLATASFAAATLIAVAAPVRGQDEDLGAITKVVRGLVDVTNAPAMAKANAAELRRAFARYYANDAAAGMKNGPIFFGPLSQPVSRGSGQQIDNIVTNLVYYRSQGIQFTIELNELQVAASGSLGVAVARTTGVMTGSDGSAAGIPGRWTAVLERNDDGRWLISHEHLSFYGANANEPWPLETLKKQTGDGR